MPTGQGLADLLSGAAGAPVNRPGLEAFVANSQATNGLRSAQTEDAMVKAQQGREQMEAYQALPQALMNAFPDMKASEAALAGKAAIAHFGDPITALKFLGTAKLGYGSPADQTAGQQMVEGKVAPLQSVPNNYAVPAGQAPPEVLQSPQGAAITSMTLGHGALFQNEADNPEAYHPKPGQFGSVSPDGQAALQKAIAEGRLDPMRVNSRTAPIFAQMEQANPGQVNFNRLHADATLQNNAAYQQKAMSVDMLPGLLSHVVTLGKALDNGHGYSDLRTVGKLQQVINGETNDPAYTEYMTARNDTLLRLAGVMRGVGMSDQAHTAEIEAMSPTLAPYALDAWLKGQMSVVNPLLERQRKITNLGEPGTEHNPRAAPPAAPGASAAAPAPAAGPSPAGLPPGLQLVN